MCRRRFVEPFRLINCRGFANHRLRQCFPLRVMNVVSKICIAAHALHLLECLGARTILIESVTVRKTGDHVTNVTIQILLQLRKLALSQQLADDHETMLIELLFLKFKRHWALLSGDWAAARCGTDSGHDSDQDRTDDDSLQRNRRDPSATRKLSPVFWLFRQQHSPAACISTASLASSSQSTIGTTWSPTGKSGGGLL